MGFKTINDFPESTNPSGNWFVLVDDGTGCYKKVKLSNLPGGGGSTTSTTTTAGGGSTTSTTTTAAGSTTSTTTTSGIDPNVAAYFAALQSVGYTPNETEQNAIENFVAALKAEEGLYSKFLAIYPMLGNNINTMKWNLINPLDTNGAYRLTPVVGGGSIIYSSTGVTCSSGAAINTYIVPSTAMQYDRNSIGVYVNENTANGFDMGAFMGETNSTFKLLYIGARVIGSNPDMSYSANGPGQATMTFTGTSDAKGFWINNRSNDQEHRLYKNGAIVGSVNTYQALSTNFPTVSLYLGGVSGVADDSTPYTLSSGRKFCFAYATNDYLLPTEITALNNATTALITTLGRN